MKAIINQKSELNSRRYPTNFVRWQSFAESLFVRQLLFTLSCLVTPLLVKGDLFQEFTITRAVIIFESFPVVNDAFEFRGEFSVNITSEGIDPVNEDLRLSVGAFVIELPPGSFTEVEPGYYVVEEEINGGGIIFELIERDDEIYVAEIRAEGVDLTGTLNPITIAIRIGNDEGEATIRIDDELHFELSDNDDGFTGDNDIDEEGDFAWEDEEYFHEEENEFEEDGHDFDEFDDEVHENEDDNFPVSIFTINDLEIRYESFPSIVDGYAVSGKILQGATNDGIDPINDGVRVAFGTSVIEIPAGAFTELEPGYFAFEGELNGAGIFFELLERDDESFKFIVEAWGIDLSETANPIRFNLIIGDNEYAALIGLDGEFAFVVSDSDEILDKEDNIDDNDNRDGNESEISDIRVKDTDGDGVVDSDDPDSDENVLLQGNGSQVGSNIEHPNGNVIDQVLLTGPSVELIADPEQISRVSFIDEDDDIVQVEFFGAGKLTIIIDPSSYELPNRPKKYNQDINYVKGSARIKVEEADASTFLSIFTVGRANAINQALFPGGETYDAIADIALLEITNSSEFGGILCANTHFSASSGDVGLKAPGVSVSVRVLIGDINARGDAVPHLLFGDDSFTVDAPIPGLRITGGDLLQGNGASIVIAQGESTNPGFEMLTSQNNVKSDGELQPTQSIIATFANEDGDDVNVATVEITIE